MNHRHLGTTAAAVALLSLAGAGPAAAVHRCTIDGRVVIQEKPCPQSGETVRKNLERRRSNEELHRMLDGMAERGVGLFARAAPAPTPRKASAPAWRHRTDAELLAERERQLERSAVEAMEQNRRAAEQLDAIHKAMAQACGDPPALEPHVGMSDKTFRECTVRARFGGIQQVVALDHEGVALRLYIFPSGPVQRVYSIDGVVTAIRP